jgi:multiple sugar transport system permease protein
MAIVTSTLAEPRSVRPQRFDAISFLQALAVWIAGAVVIVPLLLMIAISLIPERGLSNPITALIANGPIFANYARAFLRADLGTALLNSAIVTMLSTLVCVSVDALAGYSLASLSFKGRDKIFALILVTTMIPSHVTIIPLFLLFRHVPFSGGNDLFGAGGSGLLNSYWPLIIPFAASAFGTYLMRIAFKAIPREIIEAARIDGASEFRIFWSICLPLTKPTLATCGALNFTYCWNEYLLPLVMTDKRELKTVQLALSNFRGQYFTDWTLLMAATITISLPVTIVFLFTQKYIVQGISSTGMK